MSRSWPILLVCLLNWSQPASAQSLQYTTDCKIEFGEASGYISVRRPISLSFSGQVHFFLYNAAGDRISQTSVIASVTTNGHNLFHVHSISAPNGATTCAIDVSSAISSSVPDGVSRTYMTTCRMGNGIATGFVQLAQGGALSFSGRVNFYFFDEDGHFVYRDFTVASVTVTGRSRRQVTEINARRGVESCLLDISEAVHR